MMRSNWFSALRISNHWRCFAGSIGDSPKTWSATSS